MAHVWNIQDGDIYVSKNGDDVAGDGSMASPYASINKATDVGVDGNKIVIGTGVWKEARGTSSNKYNFVGGGETIIDLMGEFLLADHESLSNITVDGHGNFIYLATPLTVSFYNCTLYEVVFKKGGTGSTINLNKVLLIDCAWDLYYVNWHFVNADQVVFIRQKFVGQTERKGIYIKWLKFINSIIYDCVDGIGGTSDSLSKVDYNCFYGSFFYDEQYKRTLSEIQNTFNQMLNSFDLNPSFNSIQNKDYTLKSDSPCLFAGKNNSTIGAFGLGYSFNANSTEFTKESGAIYSQTTSVDDIIRTQQTINGITRFLFQLAAGHTSGNVESAWIDLRQIRYLLITRLFVNIIYNASGVATSRPDNLESAGEKAVYYDFELKYCNEESGKDTAVWKNVIWNKAVTVDNAGNGNADPAFVANEAQYISARFIKIKLYMTEA